MRVYINNNKVHDSFPLMLRDGFVTIQASLSLNISGGTSFVKRINVPWELISCF
jgi:hypothetical protein